MPLSTTIVAAALFVAGPQAADFSGPGFAEVSLPVLEPGSFEDWRTYLAPAPGEATFEEMGWLPTFADGLREADRTGRPLLLWVMNGHPLGCT